MTEQTPPAWATATVLRVCQPELMTDCDWPSCQQAAAYEVEFDVDGEWAAHRLCPDHHATIDADVGDGTMPVTSKNQ